MKLRGQSLHLRDDFILSGRLQKPEIVLRADVSVESPRIPAFLRRLVHIPETGIGIRDLQKRTEMGPPQIVNACVQNLKILKALIKFTEIPKIPLIIGISVIFSQILGNGFNYFRSIFSTAFPALILFDDSAIR